MLIKLAMLKNGMRKDGGEETWFVHVVAAACAVILAAAVSSIGTCRIAMAQYRQEESATCVIR